ncbi:MAG: glycosyltransferase family 39 protein [Candidatus Omnitrophica bacterium]|nr:glycosyltransferase family 39 protein [Candidatus Omnitrophota bacterium]
MIFIQNLVSAIIRNKIYSALVLLGFVFATYFNSIHNEFLIDDTLITDNYQIRNVQNFYLQFIPDINKNLNLDDRSRAVYYRPLAHLTPAVAYQLFHLNKESLRIFNMVLLWLCALIIFYFWFYLSKNKVVSFLTAIIFIIHPINGLLVNYLTANVYTVQIILMILTMLCFANKDEKSNTWLWHICGVILFIFTCLCHETSYFLPFYIIGFLIIVRRKSFGSAFKITLGLWIVLSIFILFRFFYADLKISVLDKVANQGIGFLSYVAVLSKVWFWYLSKLCNPQGIVLIWNTRAVTNYLELRSLLFIIFIFAVVLICFGFYKRKNFIAAWAGFIFLFSICVILLPAFYNPIDGVMIEPHWIIFNSLGFFFLLALFLCGLFEKSNKYVVSGLILTIIFSLMWAAHINNYFWGDPLRYLDYWSQNIDKNIASIDFYKALVYQDKNDIENAEKFYFASLHGSRVDWQVYNNLGLINIKRNEFDKAGEFFEKANAVNPQSSIINTNIGYLYFKKNDLIKAEKYCLEAIHFNPFWIQPKILLAQVYYNEKNFFEAASLYEVVIDVDPSQDKVKINLLDCYLRVDGYSQKAKSFMLQLSKLRSADVLTSVGSLLAKSGYVVDALDFYHKAITVDPKFFRVYMELGKLLGNMNRFDDAIKVWREGEKFTNNLQEFELLIKQAKELKR